MGWRAFPGSLEKVVVNGPIHPVYWIKFFSRFAPDAAPADFDRARAGEDWFQNLADDHRNPIGWRSLIVSGDPDVCGFADLNAIICSKAFLKAMQFIDAGGDFAHPAQARVGYPLLYALIAIE